MAENPFNLTVKIDPTLQSKLTGKDTTFVAGDQSPNITGLYRFCTLVDNLGLDTQYFFQDADSPWVEAGCPLGAYLGPREYWSTASRFYGAPRPDRTHSHLDALIQSSKLPRDFLCCLLGPNLGLTFFAFGNPNNSSVLAVTRKGPLRDLSTNLLLQEVAWAERMAEYLPENKQEAMYRAKAVRQFLGLHNCVHIGEISREWYINFISERSKTQFAGLVEMFRNNTPASLEKLLDAGITQLTDYYWSIDPNTGLRQNLDSTMVANKGSTSPIIVPKGIMLPIELALRGYVLAFTNMPYARRVVNLRDTISTLRNVEIPVLNLQLSCEEKAKQIIQNLYDTEIRNFQERRKNRGKPLNLEELNKEVEEAITVSTSFVPSPLIAWILGLQIVVQPEYYRDLSYYVNEKGES